MNYMQRYEAAKKAGKIQRQTYRIHTWDKEGDVLIGEVMGVTDFTGGKFDTTVNSYLLDTDLGLVSTILGTATDEQLSAVNLEGKIVCITYQGKKQLDDGRSVNIFDVDVMGDIKTTPEPQKKPNKGVTKNGR